MKKSKRSKRRNGNKGNTAGYLAHKSLASDSGIFCKNPRESTKDSLRLLFHLPKHLAARFAHRHPAVLPKSKKTALLAAAAGIVTLAAVLLIPGLVRDGADVAKEKRLQNTQFTSPAEQNRDYVCDLVIPGSRIRFPVVQGRDNQKYLHTSFTGEESLLGAIFMDYRCGGDAAPHTILYGHDAQDLDGNRLMFGLLRNYLEEAFRAAHPELLLVYGHTAKRFRLFAVKVTDTSDDAYRLNFPEGRSFAEFADRMGAPPNTKEILTLSTCLGGAGDMRLLVQGALF